MQIDEKAIDVTARALCIAAGYEPESWADSEDLRARCLKYARAAILAYESAKPKETQPVQELHKLKLGSRLTVEGVEAVVVPVEPSDKMLDAGCGKWATLYPAFDGEKSQPTAGDVADTIYRAMLSAAGDGR
jgi:hypothetical protein